MIEILLWFALWSASFIVGFLFARRVYSSGEGVKITTYEPPENLENVIGNELANEAKDIIKREKKDIGFKPLDEVLKPNKVNKDTDSTQPMAYCVRCRENIVVENPEATTTKNGKLATRGKCPNCGMSV